MKFKDQLNEYIELLDCTASELSQASGLSGATISRYRSGERVPAADSDALNTLIDGLSKIAAQKNIPLQAAAMQSAFAAILGEKFDFESFRQNLNTLLHEIQLGNAELAGILNYDPSYLSRIRSGQRQPALPQEFAAQTASGLAKYMQKSLFAPDKQQLLFRLTGISQQTFSNPPELRQALYSWLIREQPHTDAPSDSINDFLKKLDAFDLEDYIRVIHFDELKVPTVLILLPVSRHYYGVDAMKQGELDFLKSTVLSKSMEPVFMCSDMPMQDMAQDTDFSKKWMFGLAMMLKKGLHLNMIHNIDRPFQEMMYGLENWIPLYMTGQVSPYYLKDKHNSVYCHFNYVSGQTALTGECVQGYHEEGRYYLTRNKEEVAYFRQKSKRLLSAALPLMEIYRRENADAYYAHMDADMQTDGARHNILSTLPLSGTFYEKELFLTYAEYQKHMEASMDFAKQQPNYQFKPNASHAFRNIQIQILEGRWVMLSKSKVPTIHFVIRHPKMLHAFENLVIPVRGSGAPDGDCAESFTHQR